MTKIQATLVLVEVSLTAQSITIQIWKATMASAAAMRMISPALIFIIASAGVIFLMLGAVRQVGRTIVISPNSDGKEKCVQVAAAVAGPGVEGGARKQASCRRAGVEARRMQEAEARASAEGRRAGEAPRAPGSFVNAPGREEGWGGLAEIQNGTGGHRDKRWRAIRGRSAARGRGAR